MANILITYFSQSGNTEKLAKMIHDEVGGTLTPMKDANDLAAYDTVFVGTPNHAAGAAQDVKAYLGSHDLSGKTVIPFCTHGMGGEQETANDIKKLVPNSTILKSFAIKGAEVDGKQAVVAAWLTEIGMK